MGTSKSFVELGGKLVQAGNNVNEARKGSFRTAERRMLPRFRDEARRAAGADRVLSHHRSKSVMDADFKVTEGEYVSLLYINPKGPWGIRDNTDVGGKTGGHSIRPRKGIRLKFMYDGRPIYVRHVNHPGSARSAFWGRARDDTCPPLIQKRIPEETIRAIEAALAGSGYKVRG